MTDRIFSGTPEMGELFRSLSLIYLSRSDQTVKLSGPFHYGRSAYYKRNRGEFDRLTKQYSDPVRKCRIVSSSVRFLDASLGRGLFAEANVDQGEFIGEYAGMVKYASPCRPIKDGLGGYETDYTWTYPERKGLRSLEVNGRLRGNETRFINHSFTSNCHMEHTLVDGFWVLFLLARRPISRGEQFTVDYGEEYWTGGFRELILI